MAGDSCWVLGSWLVVGSCVASDSCLAVNSWLVGNLFLTFSICFAASLFPRPVSFEVSCISLIPLHCFSGRGRFVLRRFLSPPLWVFGTFFWFFYLALAHSFLFVLWLLCCLKLFIFPATFPQIQSISFWVFFIFGVSPLSSRVFYLFYGFYFVHIS